MERMSDPDRVNFKARKNKSTKTPHGVIDNQIVEPGLFPGQAPITTIDAMYMTETACNATQNTAKKG